MKPDAVRGIPGKDNTIGYSLANKSMEHRICKTCGLRVYGTGYIKETGGDIVANVACLDNVSDTELAMPIGFCNGRDNDWMHEPEIRSYP